MNELPSSFIEEFLKICFSRKHIFEIAVQHLKFSYINNEQYKKIWKEAITQYKAFNKVPSLGTIALSFKKDFEVLEAITNIKDIDESTLDEQVLLNVYEDFIKQAKFVELNDRIVDIYNEGKKQEAITLLRQGAEEIVNFSIRDRSYVKIWDDFVNRQINRQIESLDARIKIPLGIDPFDEILHGGVETGEIMLYTAGSGKGKSQALIHHGISAARRSFKVFHLQLEGTLKQVLDRYDAAWSGTAYHSMKIGDISPTKIKALRKVIERENRGEIYVEAPEKFGTYTLAHLRRSIIEAKKLYGDIKLVLLDYFELIEPDDQVYRPSEERFRQAKIGRGLKDIAVEQNVAIITATQASSISPKDENDPNFILTRYNLSEDKGKIRPFDIHITLNATSDESRNNLIRAYLDKLREFASGQTIPIATHFKTARFYDRKRSLEILADWEDEEDES